MLRILNSNCYLSIPYSVSCWRGGTSPLFTLHNSGDIALWEHILRWLLTAMQSERKGLGNSQGIPLKLSRLWLTSPECQDTHPTPGTSGGDLWILNNKDQLILLRKAIVKQFLCGLLLCLPSPYRDIKYICFKAISRSPKKVFLCWVWWHKQSQPLPQWVYYLWSQTQFFIYLIGVFLFLQI